MMQTKTSKKNQCAYAAVGSGRIIMRLEGDLRFLAAEIPL